MMRDHLVLVAMPPEQREAIRRHGAGEPVRFSTGIDGRLTYGYGNIDEYGFWQYPLRFEYLSPLQQAMVRELDKEAP